jgi:hypothetical protein
VREYGTIPVDPSDDAGDEGGISGRVSPNEQATDPMSHTLVRISYTVSSPLSPPANSDGRPCPLRRNPPPEGFLEAEFEYQNGPSKR